MNQAAINAFLQELKASIKKLESVLATTPTEESSLWYPEDPENAYGPWIEHDGKEKPSCSKTGFGQVLFAAQRTRDDFDYHWDHYFEYFSADNWCWSNRPDCNPRNKIVAYRLKREQPFVHEEEYEEDDEPVTKKKLGARKAAEKTAVRKKPWYPPTPKGFGPWVEYTGDNSPQTTIDNSPQTTICGVLMASERNNKHYEHEANFQSEIDWNNSRRSPSTRIVAYCGLLCAERRKSLNVKRPLDIHHK